MFLNRLTAHNGSVTLGLVFAISPCDREEGSLGN